MMIKESKGHSESSSMVQFPNTNHQWSNPQDDPTIISGQTCSCFVCSRVTQGIYASDVSVCPDLPVYLLSKSKHSDCFRGVIESSGLLRYSIVIESNPERYFNQLVVRVCILHMRFDSAEMCGMNLNCIVSVLVVCDFTRGGQLQAPRERSIHR